VIVAGVLIPGAQGAHVTRRLVHGIDLTAPDGVARLLDWHRARWGSATMTAPTGTQPAGSPPGQTGEGAGGGAGGGAGQPPAGGQSGGEGRSGSNGGGQGGEQPQFTQKDLDRIIGERLAAEKAKYDQQLKDAQALAGKNETEKLTIERDQAVQRATEARDKAAEKVARTEAKVAAIAAGANPQRVDAIVRNADLAAAVKDGEVDEAAVKAAVEKVLGEYPEWKAGAQQGGGAPASGGEMNGGGGTSKPTFTRKQLEEMPPQEMATRIEEINEAIAEGRVTG
jgi:hypothetical protein